MAQLAAGAARHEVTPPVGYMLSGYSSRTQGSIGVHDPLYAKALALKAGDSAVGIISCDIISVPQRSVEEARAIIGKVTGVVGSNVMIHGTHTHTGPNNDNTGDEWKTVLGRKIAGVFLEAWRNLRPAMVGLGAGECFVGVNRRRPSSPEGPHVLYSWPDGPFEPSVMVLRVDSMDGGTICTIVNYGCHGVTLGPHELMISRDFSGYAVDIVERAKPGSVCMFLNAPCGNVNPRWIWEVPQEGASVPRFNWADKEPRWSELKSEERFREAQRLGNILGGESLKVLEQIIEFRAEVGIISKSRRIKLPVREDPPEWYKRHLRMNEGAAEREFELQVIGIDETAVLGLPGEVFLELGAEIRKKSPFKRTLMAELCNQESEGYILTAQAYEEGGYEPTASILKPDAGAMLVRESLRLLEEAHGG